MIKANELRIGNIVRVSNLIGHVTDITTKPDRVVIDFSPDYEYIPEYLEGVLLTETILLQNGYEKEGSIFSVGVLLIQQHMTDSTWFLMHRILDNDYAFISAGFYYIHQLQNIYFVLTGNELTIATGTANVGTAMN